VSLKFVEEVISLFFLVIAAKAAMTIRFECLDSRLHGNDACGALTLSVEFWRQEPSAAFAITQAPCYLKTREDSSAR
jgi:hypothetical protein